MRDGGDRALQLILGVLDLACSELGDLSDYPAVLSKVNYNTISNLGPHTVHGFTPRR